MQPCPDVCRCKAQGRFLASSTTANLFSKAGSLWCLRLTDGTRLAGQCFPATYFSKRCFNRVCTHVLWHFCGGLRTTLGSWLSLPCGFWGVNSDCQAWVASAFIHWTILMAQAGHQDKLVTCVCWWSKPKSRKHVWKTDWAMFPAHRKNFITIQVNIT